MKRAIIILAILAFAVSYVNAEEAAVEKEKVLADVNGVKITLNDFQEQVDSLPQNYQQAINANKRKFLDELVLKELLYQEAVKKDLDKDEKVLAAIADFKIRVMSQKVLEDVLESVSLSEDEAKKDYEENKDDYKTKEQINAAHILIRVQEEDDDAKDKAALEKAEGILKQIKEGADFSELAKENSDCPSGAKGGELGYFSRGQMVPEFEEAAFKLKAGEVSEIVKTNFGYHIIKVLDKKEAKQKEFDEVKEEIETQLLAEKQKKALMDYAETLRGKAKITINEELL